MRTYTRLACLLALVAPVPLVLLLYMNGRASLPGLEGAAGAAAGGVLLESLRAAPPAAAGDGGDATAPGGGGAQQRGDDGPTWNMTAEYYSAPADACDPTSNENTVLVYVYTAPRNVEKRKKIRVTWASVRAHGGTDFRVLFFVGRVTSYALQLSLAREQRQYGDMVQDKSYVDSYRNLTRKGLSALLWVTQRCPGLFRVVKVDDDTLVNPYNLIDTLRGLSEATLQKFVCPVTTSAKPIRKPSNKYFVSADEFDGDYYPMYCQGYAYTIPPPAITSLLEAALNNTLFSMEDVFITGLLASYHNLTHYPLSNYYSTTFRDGSTEDLINKILTRPNMIFIGHTKAMVYYDLFWKLVSKEPTSAPAH